ncbi:MAG: transcription antitermination factor NusB [Nitriliruptorales bacterium]|nr:transcription antitermination factor NusB [Nitriliruptorales bacterium]
MTEDPRVPSPGPPLASDNGEADRPPSGAPPSEPSSAPPSEAPPADAPPSDATPGRRPDTGDPHRSRERALKVLFQADVRGIEPVAVLRRLTSDRSGLDLLDATEDEGPQSSDGSDPLDGFSRALVLGVNDHREEIDALLDEHAEGWTVRRMPVVDRNILRLGTYELLHEDTPPAVVISEAIELAKELSTERSYRFVNGVLEAIRRSADEGGA